MFGDSLTFVDAPLLVPKLSLFIARDYNVGHKVIISLDAFGSFGIFAALFAGDQWRVTPLRQDWPKR